MCEAIVQDFKITNTANQTFKNHDQLSEKQKAKALKCITIHKESIAVKKVFQGKQDVKRIQNNLLPMINNCISQRFESFDDEIFKAMAVVDHHRWDFEGSNYGIKDIKVIADYFKSFLAYHKYDHQAAILEF